MSSNIKILHVEDNILDQRTIRTLLHGLGYTELYQCRTSEEAEKILSEQEIDLAILDIILEGSSKDGVTLGIAIQKKVDIPILFTSSLSDDQTINRTENLPDCEYIVKPVPERQLYVAINKLFVRYMVLDNTSQTLNLSNHSFFFVKTQKKFLTRINNSDLLYLEADKGGTIIHHNKGIGYVYIPLHGLVTALKHINMLRCHMSYAVMIDAIIQYSDEEIVLSNKKYIPVSRSYKKQVRALLDQLIIKAN